MRVGESLWTWGQKLLTASSNSLLKKTCSHKKAGENGFKETPLHYYSIYERRSTGKQCVCSLYEFSHRADGDRNAWLINWADAFVVGGFNDRHLLFFFWETGNGHSAADAGVPWHHRLSGDCFTALWIRKEAEKEETDVLVIQVLHKLQLNVCNG